MNTQEVIIKLMDGTTVKGRTNLGTHKRLSDCLNRDGEPFIVLFDVLIQGQLGKVLFVNKNQIMWAMPVE